MSTDPFVQQLRTNLDLEALHSRIEPEAALAAGRRAARRHTIGTATAGALAVAAVGVGALTLPSLAPGLHARPADAASASSPAPTATDRAVVELAPGLTAATGVTRDGEAWTSDLTFGAHDVGLAPATSTDLDEASAASGLTVDHGLRVILAPDSNLVPVVAWGATRGATPLRPHTYDPIEVTTYRTPGEGQDDPPLTTRLFAGVVPPWMPDARVVLFTRATMRVGGSDVHAVEIPTFADPAGSGTRVYLAVADPEVPRGGYAPEGLFLVSPDGTFLELDGDCTMTPELCSAPRPDGLDLRAELLAALGR